MKPINLITVLLILLITTDNLFAQSSATSRKDTLITTDLEKEVLQKQVKNKVFRFEDFSTESILRYEVTYLGSLTTDSDKQLHFLFLVTYSGLYEDAIRCNSSIVVYNNNTKIGDYYIGGLYTIKPKIKDDILIITPNGEDCDTVSTISFREGIPQEIFLKCTENGNQINGDTYTFSAEKH